VWLQALTQKKPLLNLLSINALCAFPMLASAKNTAWALRILVFICIFALLGFFWLKIGLIAKLLVVNLKALLP
jgi:hypothetical protein